jgi:hypothetical protein
MGFQPGERPNNIAELGLTLHYNRVVYESEPQNEKVMRRLRSR